jgi:hypothetical protein
MLSRHGWLDRLSGPERTRGRRVLWLSATVGVLLGPSPLAAAALVGTSRCGGSGSRVLVRTRDAVIFQRHLTVFGCWRSGGRVTRLSAPGLAVRTISLAGVYVGLEQGYSGEQVSHEILVYDLRTGRLRHHAPTGPASVATKAGATSTGSARRPPSS